MATEEEVAQKAAEVKELRQNLADRRRSREEGERAVSNELTLANLEAEEIRLRAELAAEERAAEPQAVIAGAQAPIAAVKDQMMRAVAAQQAGNQAPDVESVPAATTTENDGSTQDEGPVARPTTPPPAKATKATAKAAGAGEGK